MHFIIIRTILECKTKKKREAAIEVNFITTRNVGVMRRKENWNSSKITSRNGKKTLIAQQMILQFCIKAWELFLISDFALVHNCCYAKLFALFESCWKLLVFTSTTQKVHPHTTDTKSQLSVAWNEDTTTRCLFRLDEQNENSWKLHTRDEVSVP